MFNFAREERRIAMSLDDIADFPAARDLLATQEGSELILPPLGFALTA